MEDIVTLAKSRNRLSTLIRRSRPSRYDSFSRMAKMADVHWQLVAQAGIEPGAVVLDIGTGTAAALLLAKRAIPGARMIGLDPDADALALAARKASAAGLDLQLDRGSADRLPYPDESIDRVLSAFMFHHLSPAEKDAVLLEVRRVLVPGGRLHLLDVDTDPRDQPPAKRFGGHRHSHNHHEHAHAGDKPSSAVPELMAAAGFVDVAEAGRGTSLVGPHTFFRASR
jgi:ubiquinone/menaquinone biosynthesis C-methylase UbiE